MTPIDAMNTLYRLQTRLKNRWKGESMNFHILTLFPDMVVKWLKDQHHRPHIESGAISVEAVDIRDYTTDKHRHVDDAPIWRRRNGDPAGTGVVSL